MHLSNIGYIGHSLKYAHNFSIKSSDVIGRCKVPPPHRITRKAEAKLDLSWIVTSGAWGMWKVCHSAEILIFYLFILQVDVSLLTLRTVPSTWWMETRWVASTPSPSTGTSASGFRSTVTWPPMEVAGLWVATELSYALSPWQSNPASSYQQSQEPHCAGTTAGLISHASFPTP